MNENHIITRPEEKVWKDGRSTTIVSCNTIRSEVNFNLLQNLRIN
jgi:hypothetical protein